ncbi:MAG TPA: glycoside hydrolase family 15 protein [Gemmatimonadaceae bacterium]|nr:glycoside hydrolase family 15 protein [Gemmatimonadaceae bacterium]
MNAGGTIDWLCLPRFDSPSVFASLLDHERGGFCRIKPASEDGVVTRQMYLPGTPILITRFMSPDGVGEVIDFMPIAGKVATDRHRLVRLIRIVRGRMRFEVEVKPRFDYGREQPDMEIVNGAGAIFSGKSMSLTLSLAPEEGVAQDVELFASEGGFVALASLSAGQVGGMVLESAAETGPHRIPAAEIRRLLEETRDYWRDWIAHSRYRGRWREMVERSAMILKLMTYAPSGALVAAPTAGLPENVGGERNWDYRYTWIRDASFSVYALLSLGFTEEAEAYLKWLGQRIHDSKDGRAPLQIMYRIDGSPDLGEETLEHLEGYRGSRPVRIGNGAADQLQLDIYGEALDSLFLGAASNINIGYKGWNQVAGLVDWLCDNWDRPEEGIWETRGGQQDFVYGRLMSWTAFDRAIRLSTMHSRPADVPRWTRARDDIYRQIMTRGFHDSRKAFVQHYQTDVLDASLLYMPLVGFVSPTDPMWQSTLKAMDEELVSDSLVFRYDPAASPDGLIGAEGTFSICTFWYVNVLARSGRLEEARLTFDKMLTYGNHLGLYSEEVGPSGEQLGNFPQAFSHLALITAAVDLDRLLDHGDGSHGAVPAISGLAPAR